MKKGQKDFFRVKSLGKIAGLVFGAGLFLLCFSVISAKADSPYLTKHGEVFHGTLATSNYARVIKVGNIYHLWYEATAAKTLYHTTSADGENWNAEAICNAVNVHEPSIIWDSTEAHFKMWYESLEAGHSGEIWYTESGDGITWDAPQEVNFTDGANSWEDNGRYMPFVIKDGLTYKMWYQSASAADPGDKRINYATSNFGLTWDNSGEYGLVNFGGNTNNNIVYAIGGVDEWDEGGIYSQAIINLTAELDGGGPVELYLMLYGGLSSIPGDFYKIGGAGSEDGIEWYGMDEHILSSEGAGDVWFPSMVLNMNDDDLDNAFLQIWYMKGTEVHYATLGELFQNYIDEYQKAHIDSWKAYRYKNTNKSCSSRLKLIIKGKHFDKDAEVKIGNHKASSVDRKSSKKIVAKFCMDKLLKSKTSKKKVISVTNPDADTEKADKKINLDNVDYDTSADDLDSQTVEGVKNIQAALAELGFLDEQYITGIYGPITTEAVRKFQEQNGLPATGYVGPLTKAKLEEKLK